MNNNTRTYWFLIILIIIVVIAGYFLTRPYSTGVITTTTTTTTQSQSSSQTSTPPPTNSNFEPYRATLVGEYLCLPHTNTSGPQTLECALGMKTDDGKYYAVDFSAMSQTGPNIATGERFTATGTVTPVQRLSSNHWQKYPIVGIFSVTDSVRKITATTPTSSTLQMSIGQSATGIGVTLTPLEVTSDSRCPANVNCIWEGTVNVRTRVKNSVGTSEVIFELGKEVTLGAENITLTNVAPQKTMAAIATSSYVFTYEVVKR